MGRQSPSSQWLWARKTSRQTWHRTHVHQRWYKHPRQCQSGQGHWRSADSNPPVPGGEKVAETGHEPLSRPHHLVSTWLQGSKPSASNGFPYLKTSVPTLTPTSHHHQHKWCLWWLIWLSTWLKLGPTNLQADLCGCILEQLTQGRGPL